jgi:hypothetical protein
MLHVSIQRVGITANTNITLLMVGKLQGSPTSLLSSFLRDSTSPSFHIRLSFVLCLPTFYPPNWVIKHMIIFYYITHIQ